MSHQEQQYLQIFISNIDKDFGVLAYQHEQLDQFDQSCHLQEFVMQCEQKIQQLEKKVADEISLSKLQQQTLHTLTKAIKTWTLQNNRTQIRTHCRFHAKIKHHSEDSSELGIRLINLSLNGACLELSKEQLQWDVGDHVLVTTPESAEHLAVVRWIRVLEDSVSIGVLFNDQKGQLFKVVS